MFDRMQQPEPLQRLFKSALGAWSKRRQSQARLRTRDVEQQLDDVRGQQERLLNRRLAGAVDEQLFAAKNMELRDRVAKLTLEMEAADRRKDERADLAVRVFELSQDLRRKWLTAGFAEKRRLLNFVCLNLVLQGATVVISTRKPFNCLVEGLSVSDSGEGEIRTPVTFRLTGFRNRRVQPLRHLSGCDRMMLAAPGFRVKMREGPPC